MFPTFYKKKVYSQKKKISPNFWKIFSPGGHFQKNFPRGFSGDPRENFRKSRKFPENPGKFRGFLVFPGWKRGLTLENSGNFSPKKCPPGKNSRDFPKKCPPGNSGNSRKFPEIFPRISRGGPRGGPADVSGQNRGFLA